MSHRECHGNRGSEGGGTTTEGHLTRLAGVTATHLPAATREKRVLPSPSNRDAVNLGGRGSAPTTAVAQPRYLLRESFGVCCLSFLLFRCKRDQTPWYSHKP